MLLKKSKECLINTVYMILIIATCTVVSLIIDKFHIKEENIIMVYLLGIIFIIIKTKGYTFGIISSIICIGIFNFLFTIPKLTFYVNDPNYIVTFTIFLMVSIITSRLITQLQTQVKRSKENEAESKFLYEMNQSYLHIYGIDNVIMQALKTIDLGKKFKSFIYLLNDEKKLDKYYLKQDYNTVKLLEDEKLIEWCYKNGIECNNGDCFYMPLKLNGHILGTICIYTYGKEILSQDKVTLRLIISQMEIALERELLYKEKSNVKLEVEKEKLRSNLLRSISHDLRTPLTGISGLSSLILDNYDELDKETILSFVSDIQNDTIWLNNLVENLLNMTRIQDGKLLIKKENQVIDDIIYEAVRRARRIETNRVIEVSIPDKVYVVPMDAKLIIQVLINLLDNAIKHTKDFSKIILSVEEADEYMSFKINDNGGGIKQEVMDTIFDSFVSSTIESSDKYRGIGLGLSICKSIVQAHNGTIEAYNNNLGGATFEFKLPIFEED